LGVLIELLGACKLVREACDFVVLVVLYLELVTGHVLFKFCTYPTPVCSPENVFIEGFNLTVLVPIIEKPIDRGVLALFIVFVLPCHSVRPAIRVWLTHRNT
jgi:hypothetical protein